ncbi:MAG: hypothetical protein ABIS59_01200 [Candidatus Saccharibacteria bacterium]
MSRRDQTHVRDYPLLHQVRERLTHTQSIAFEEAVILKAALPAVECPETQWRITKRIEVRLAVLANAILIGAHVKSAHGVQKDVEREANYTFWVNNIDHAATHIRAKLV